MVNPGSNFYSFNPYWAATLFIMPRWKTSWRLHYLWNAKNDEPIKALFGPGGPFPVTCRPARPSTSTSASAFELLPKQLHVGVNGYYLKQITDTKVTATNIDGTREQVLGIGPGGGVALLARRPPVRNFYFETQARIVRRARSGFNLRWTHHF